MIKFLRRAFAAFALVFPGLNLQAGVAFPDPGWTYVYEGALATNSPPGSGFISLDGTWSHDNPSDEWDGSTIGGPEELSNRPGGVTNLVEGAVTYLRIQDPGDPRDFGFEDPSSNRKIFFGHDLSSRGITNAILNDGITFSFRARVPTNGPLDRLYLPGSTTPASYPATGDGHLLSNAGKGNISVGQADGAVVSFSLNVASDALPSETAPAPAGFSGMTFNESAGNFPSLDIDFGQGSGTNRLTFNSTAWQEFWIVLRSDPEQIATHQLVVYTNGSTAPRFFKVTASPESDFVALNYIGFGTPSSGQSSALDLDFIAYKAGVVLPPGAAPLPDPTIPGEPARITSFSASGNTLSFVFTAQAGKSYRVEYKTSLSQADWTPLTTLQQVPAGPATVTDDIAPSSQRFYRIVSL